MTFLGVDCEFQCVSNCYNANYLQGLASGSLYDLLPFTSSRISHMGVRIVRDLWHAASFVNSSYAPLGLVVTYKSCHILGITLYGFLCVSSFLPEYPLLCLQDVQTLSLLCTSIWCSSKRVFFSRKTLVHLTHLKSVFCLTPPLSKLTALFYIKIFQIVIVLCSGM